MIHRLSIVLDNGDDGVLGCCGWGGLSKVVMVDLVNHMVVVAMVHLVAVVLWE
jgi:hypothetical protein